MKNFVGANYKQEYAMQAHIHQQICTIAACNAHMHMRMHAPISILSFSSMYSFLNFFFYIIIIKCFN